MQAAEGARRESTAEQANDLRAAVLGFNDGLVANLGLVMGVAGATLSSHAVTVAGLAGLIAGALSMALGEWVSVQSSREMYQSRLARLTTAFERDPTATRARLIEMEAARGLDAAAGAAAADRLLRDRDEALHALAAYELGIAYGDVGGSPWGAWCSPRCRPWDRSTAPRACRKSPRAAPDRRHRSEDRSPAPVVQPRRPCAIPPVFACGAAHAAPCEHSRARRGGHAAIRRRRAPGRGCAARRRSARP
jgi:VIT family